VLSSANPENLTVRFEGAVLVLPSMVALIWYSLAGEGAVYVLVSLPVELLVLSEAGLKLPPMPDGSVVGWLGSWPAVVAAIRTSPNVTVRLTYGLVWTVTVIWYGLPVPLGRISCAEIVTVKSYTVVDPEVFGRRIMPA